MGIKTLALVGKPVELNVPLNSSVTVATGIILATQPSVWVMFPCQIEAIEAIPGEQLTARLFESFITFSPIAGTPAARFGTGQGDPGYVSDYQGQQYVNMVGVSYAVANGSNSILRFEPFLVDATGEVSLRYQNQSLSKAGYAKALLSFGAPVILPFAPV